MPPTRGGRLPLLDSGTGGEQRQAAYGPAKFIADEASFITRAVLPSVADV